jgi:hypothetical protein
MTPSLFPDMLHGIPSPKKVLAMTPKAPAMAKEALILTREALAKARREPKVAALHAPRTPQGLRLS